MRLTLAQAQYLLKLISEREGIGYSENAEVGKLQAYLSIQAQLGANLGDSQDPLVPREYWNRSKGEQG